MRVVYFDCFSGAAGDIILGALVDAGAPREGVQEALGALPIAGPRLSFREITSSGLRALRAEVDVEDDHASRAHLDIVSILQTSSLNEGVRRRALTTFETLAAAEGRIHGISPENVHFHEVNSLDAIVDIVACCAALELLAPSLVVTSAIATGTGTTTSSHGSLPLPAPAVTEILRARGATLFARGTVELVTPTGAALLATFTDRFGDLPPMSISSIGYGAGGRKTAATPNVLRALVGALATNTDTDSAEALVIEANVDDMSPELMPHLMERLLDAGAQDAWVTPIVMKKGRPAHMLSALVAPEHRQTIATLLFEEATTFGLRWSAVTKEMLERRWIETSVAGHAVRVKIAEREGAVVGVAPEHDDALSVARATGLPLRRVYELALEAARTR